MSYFTCLSYKIHTAWPYYAKCTIYSLKRNINGDSLACVIPVTTIDFEEYDKSGKMLCLQNLSGYLVFEIIFYFVDIGNTLLIIHTNSGTKFKLMIWLLKFNLTEMGDKIKNNIF